MRGRTAFWVPRWVGVALVAGLLLVGCSDPDEPATFPRTSDSPTPTSSSPSPTPTTPEAQVEVAVRTYYAELNRALQSNDVSDLKPLVDKGCPCYNAVKIIERNSVEKERTPDAAFSLKSVRVHDIFGTTAAAEVKYEVSAYDVIAEDGEIVTRIKAQRSHYDLSLVRTEAGWILANLFNLEG